MAFFTPLWFVWHRRWVEVAIVWLVLFGVAWEAIGRSLGWVRSDALRIATIGVVAEILALMPSPVIGPSPGGSAAIVLMIVLGAWAFRLDRRGAVAAANRWSVLASAALVALGVGAFTGLRVPGTKPRAYVAAMRHDLQRLAAVQESSFAVRQVYARSLDELPFERSTGVTVFLEPAGDSGWSARATHNATSATCHVGGGRPAGGVPAAGTGEPVCELPRLDIPWSRGIPPAGH